MGCIERVITQEITIEHHITILTIGSKEQVDRTVCKRWLQQPSSKARTRSKNPLGPSAVRKLTPTYCLREKSYRIQLSYRIRLYSYRILSGSGA